MYRTVLYIYLFILMFNGTLWAIDRLPGVTLIDPFDNSTLSTTCSGAEVGCIPQPNLGGAFSGGGASTDNTILGNITHPFNSSNPSQTYPTGVEANINIVSWESAIQVIRMLTGNFLFSMVLNVFGVPFDFLVYLVIPSLVYVTIIGIAFYFAGKG